MSTSKKVTFEYRPHATEARNAPYKCIKVVNSLEFNPGDWYKDEVVSAHCNNPKWDVTIVE